MKIRYSVWKAILQLILGGFFALILNFIFLALLFAEWEWISKLLASVIFGPLALGLNLVFLSALVTLFHRRDIFIFDNEAVTHYYGFFRNKTLVIPYNVIEEVGIGTRRLGDDFSVYFGKGKAKTMRTVLKASELIQPSYQSADSVLGQAREVLSILFKKEGQALAYAQRYGIKLKGRLAEIDEENRLDIDLGPVAKFSEDEMVAYIESRRSIK